MSSSEDIRIVPGEPIPLRAQETDGITNKVIRATIFRDEEMTDVLAGPIELTHNRNGFYSDDSVVMPLGLRRAYAQYLVFESNGVTANLDGDKVVTDVFVAVKDGDAVLNLIGGPEGVAKSDEDETVGHAEMGETSEAFIDETESAVGIARDDEETDAISEGQGDVSGQVEGNQTTVGETGGC